VKALTLTQPWATLVAIGAKRIETRSWWISYRGPIAIHAAKGFPGWAKDTAQNEEVFRRALGWPEPGARITQEWIDAIAANLKALPRGQVIATATLVDCLPVERLDGQYFAGSEVSFGDYSDGRFGWLLEDVKPITPVPAKGALGLWNWEALHV
jgi:hypothetical protein